MSAVTILHTADWQIGKVFRNIPGDAGGLLRQQRFSTVKNIAALAAERSADAVLVTGDSVRDAARQKKVDTVARLGQSDEILSAERKRLAEDRARQSDADIAASAEAADAVLTKRKKAAGRLAAEFQSALPDSAELTLGRARKALDATRQRMEENERRIATLKGELRGAGQQGLGEREAEIKAMLAEARRRYERFEAEAGALTLLHETLTSAERAAKDTFIGPVRQRIEPYLRLVFPAAALSLNTDDLSVSGLRRDGAEEPFGTLSIGTREQVAVLARLAMADFLLSKGQPVCVILDDTLVYSDDTRFEGMLNALTKAAENLQIIILTCRERDFHALGAPIFRLQDCLISGG